MWVVRRLWYQDFATALILDEMMRADIGHDFSARHDRGMKLIFELLAFLMIEGAIRLGVQRIGRNPDARMVHLPGCRVVPTLFIRSILAVYPRSGHVPYQPL